MAAVWFVSRSEWRRRMRSSIALVLLVAVVGGAVLAAVAAGRRTADAFPRFVSRYGYDLFAYADRPLPGLTRLPEVRSVVPVESPANGRPACSCGRIPASDFSIEVVPRGGLDRYAKLVSGREPDPSKRDEVLASFNLAQDYDVHIGSVVRVPFYTREQAAGSGSPGAPRGPTLGLRVVGLSASEGDFPGLGTPTYTLLATPAFARFLAPRSPLFTGWAVRLRHGHRDVAEFRRDASALGALGTDATRHDEAVNAAIHPQAMGWWLLAALLGLVGAVVIGQALGRQARLDGSSYRTLSALGLSPAQLTTVGLLRAVAVGVTGAVAAVAVAFALSPLTPVGEARVAEPSGGLRFDALVLGAGALALVLVVVVLGTWPAVRAARALRTSVADEPRRRASRVVSALTSAGARPTIVIGVRRALERGRGRTAVPVGTALAGAALAVGVLSGTTVFGASLAHLTASPHLYGQSFQLWFNNLDTGTSAAEPILRVLRSDPAVRAVTLGTSGSASINGVPTEVIAGRAVEGKLLVSSTGGRVPTRRGEVALARKTMDDVGAHVGSIVRVTVALPGGGEATSRFRVVGAAAFPPDFGVVGLNRGAIFTVDGFIGAQCPSPTAGQCTSAVTDNLPFVVLVGTRPGPTAERAVARYARQYPDQAVLPVTPANLVNFGEAVDFPLILEIALLAFGVAMLVHVLGVSVTRRRRESALLKSFGFVRRQVAASVCWQAVTVAVVALVVGVPVGIVAGRTIWVRFARNLGVVPVEVVPGADLVVLGFAVLAGTVALAVIPALASARGAPAAALRDE